MDAPESKRLRTSGPDGDTGNSSSSTTGPKTKEGAPGTWRSSDAIETHSNEYIRPLLTDTYQVTMAYAYFNSNMHEQEAVFDLFFRKNPFHGEYTVFAGLTDVVKFVEQYRFRPDEIEFLRRSLPGCSDAFFEWLSKVDCSKLRIYALPEGTVCFPRVPLLRIEGPLATFQLLETTLLNLVNYPTLMATNAARHRRAAGPNKTLLEFGLRRAQGPDGAMSAARYAYLGGFDGTSNLLASFYFGIKASGTHAHSFVTAFRTLTQCEQMDIVLPSGAKQRLLPLVRAKRAELGLEHTHDGELAAFIAYASSYPNGFLALVDTYDTLGSGVNNFLCVAATLDSIGYRALGIRLDSGDLAYLSGEARKMFESMAKKLDRDYFSSFNIVASNDLNEHTIYSLNQQGHSIDSFGIGTHLVTCQAQPALGAVFKLVEIQGFPRIKLSNDPGKVTIPCRKDVYRLYGRQRGPTVDVMTIPGEETPEVGKQLLCMHPADDKKRAYVTPTKVVPLLKLLWDNGTVVNPIPHIETTRKYVHEQLESFREDHLRPLNPTPYKVSLTSSLFHLTRKIWLDESPIRDIS